MSTNFPSQTKNFANEIEMAMTNAYTLSLGSNLLCSSTMPDTHPEDPEFIKDRATLRARNGGAGIRPLLNREHFLNCANNVMHQLSDHTDSANNVTPGLFKILQPFLVNDWMTSPSQTATEFNHQLIKGKNLHTQLIDNIMSSKPADFERPKSLYIEQPLSLGKGIKKLQKN